MYQTARVLNDFAAWSLRDGITGSINGKPQRIDAAELKWQAPVVIPAVE